MAEKTGIAWCDMTFNPWIGCSKVSPACANCYAERDMDHRHKRVRWGPQGTRSVTTDANWRKPLQWSRCQKVYEEEWKAFCDVRASSYDPNKPPRRPRVFCASLADVFEDWQGPIWDHRGQKLFWSHSRQADQSEHHWIAEPDTAGGEQPVTMDDVRRRLFALIDATPNLDWLLLTKRPENIRQMWPTWPIGFSADGSGGHGSGARYLKNVWLGTSVENQEYADKRIPELLKCSDLARVLFLSCEPLLGPVEFSNVTKRSDAVQQLGKKSLDGINWVICGGESGPKSRPMQIEWARSLKEQCEAAKVPFFMKQLSQADTAGFKDFAAFPADLQVRQFPNS